MRRQGKGADLKTQVIDYQIREASYLGYAALPEEKKFPAVIVAHTWAGRDRFVDDKAEMLASMGYLGFALDMYGDGFIGFIHQVVIDYYLSKHDSPEDIEVYFCGPPLMNQAIERMAEDFGVPPENVRFDDFGG